ncbi:MAG TPA: amidohydrolase family protein [Terriglobales bacterium]|nr:amidohydrolase family protein [Terriglobales bacterium]
MTIDSHQHFWRYNPVRDGWITDEMAALKRDYLPEHLLTELKLNQVEACIAVQADQSEDETMFLVDLAERHGFIRGVVGWVDLRSDRLPERLKFFSQFEKLCGFRHIVQSEDDERFLLRKNFLRGISELQAFGFTYDLLVYARQLPAAVEFAARFPEQKFVVDHIAKPEVRAKEIAGWERWMRQMAALANVHCKLSGMVTEADWMRWRPSDFEPYLDVVFDCFGSDRLMFGSDWPVCQLAGSYCQVKKIISDYTNALPQCEKDKIFGLNAAKFYGLAA